MLIAALTILLLGGGSDNLWLFPEKFNDRVKKVISEEQRQSEIMAIYDTIKEHTGRNGHSYDVSRTPSPRERHQRGVCPWSR